MLRYGFHSYPTYLLIDFDTQLDAAAAEDTANFKIVGPSGHRIKVRSAIYDPAAESVTLVPGQQINVHETYHLFVNGTRSSGVQAPGGLLMDGKETGHPGSNYATSLTWRNLAGQAGKLPTLGLLHQAVAPASVHAAPPRHHSPVKPHPGSVTPGTQHAALQDTSLR